MNNLFQSEIAQMMEHLEQQQQKNYSYQTQNLKQPKE